MLSVAVVLLGAVATTWTSHGPFGGSVRAFDASRSDSAVLYAGNVNGVFRTNDGGETWQSVGDGLGAIYLLTVDPTNPNIVFAGGSRKVFKSSDGGSHWRSLSLPKELRPSAVRLDPLDPRTVYVGSTCSGYYPESYDDAPGVYKSTDGGETWKASYSGIKPNTALYPCVDELALDPGTPTHLYTLTRWSTSQRWESFDAATAWDPSPTLLPTRGLVPHPTFALTRYGISSHSVLVTNDGGLTWSATAGSGLPPLKAFNDLVIDPNTGRLFLGTDAGLFRSGDGGQSWIEVNGATRAVIYHVAIAGKQLVVATAQGLFRGPITTFGPFQQADLGDPAADIAQIAVDPHDPAVVYVSTRDAAPPPDYQGRVFRTRDSGQSWELLSDVDPHDRTAIVVDAAHDLYAAGANGVFKREAARGRWVSLNSPVRYARQLAADPVTPGVIYAVGIGGEYRTLDGGNTWQQLDNLYVGDSVAVDSRGVVYLADVNGIFRSTDRGATWNKLPGSEFPTWKIAVAPSKSTTLYRLARYSPSYPTDIFFSLMRSDDSGNSWNLLRWPGERDFNGMIAIDPSDENRLWLSSNAHGVVESDDGGTTWRSLSEGLPTLDIPWIAIDPAGTILHAATATAGVWELPVGRRHRGARH